MGTVIQFPFERLSRSRPAERRSEPAAVIILPNVRVERWTARHQPKLVAVAAKSSGMPRLRPSE